MKPKWNLPVQQNSNSTLTTHVSSKVMYTEFKVYQLNFKPSCPSNPHPLNGNRKYIVVSQLYYIAAWLLMMKSYKLDEWPKTVIRDQVPVQLHISLPQNHFWADWQLTESCRVQGYERRQVTLFRAEWHKDLGLMWWEPLTLAWNFICD